MTVIVLERGAGWHWGWTLVHRLGPNVTVLSQDVSEPFDLFASRVKEELRAFSSGGRSLRAVLLGVAGASAAPALASHRLLARTVVSALPRATSIVVLPALGAELPDSRVELLLLDESFDRVKPYIDSTGVEVSNDNYRATPTTAPPSQVQLVAKVAQKEREELLAESFSASS